MKTLNWNQMTEIGLTERFNIEILHPLGLSVKVNPITGYSEHAIISNDGFWLYPEGHKQTNKTDEEIREFIDGVSLNSKTQRFIGTSKRVAKWNADADKHPVPIGNSERKQTLLNQLDRIQEELKEAYSAVYAGDELECLDAGCDLDITVSGYNYLLDHDYDGAINAVLDNNDTKLYMPHEIHDAALDAAVLSRSSGEEHSVRASAQKDLTGNDIESLEECGVVFSVHRDRDDKVCKPPGFIDVDLKSFLNI